MARILKPGGKLLLSTPFLYCLHEMPHDYFRYTAFALRHYVEEQGLQVCQITPLGGTLEVLADIAAKHLEIVPLIGKPLAVLVQLLAVTGPRFPLEYFMVAQKPS